MKKSYPMMAALFVFLLLLSAGAYADDTPQDSEIIFSPVFGQTEARSMLDMVNEFRTGDEAFYWNERNTETVSSKGEPLTYSYALEEIAMQRAAEIALSFSHTRPDGTLVFSAIASNGTRSLGENIAVGSSTAGGAFEMWREDGQNYSGQGHRRNMLRQDYASIGIGHVSLDGVHYWVQEFGVSVDSAPETAALNTERSTSVTVSTERLQNVENLTANPNALTLQTGGHAALPAVSAAVTLSDAWLGEATAVTLKPIWTSGNASVCTVKGQEASGVAAGTATLVGVALGETVSVFVTVSADQGGEEPANGVYAILYDDGTLVFQNGNEPDIGRTVKKVYPVDLTAVYVNPSYAPWYEARDSIRAVKFADKISPVSAARWFFHCEKLERIDNIQNLLTSNVTDMSGMFYNCGALTELDVSGFDTANVTDMSGMFYNCGALTELDVSGFGTANVTDMSEMFFGCSKLVTIYASDEFQTVSVSYSDNMFSGCKALIGGHDTKYSDNHKDASYARIDAASAPGYFSAQESDEPALTDEAYAILYDDGTMVFQSGNTPDAGRTVTQTYPVDLTAVYDYHSYTPWYEERESIRVVNFADKIAPVSTAYWFLRCNNLERIDNIQNLYTASVTSMHGMFHKCGGLKELDVSKWNTSNVTDMNSMFADCNSLKVLDVSQWNTANVTDMRSMFRGCSGLETLNVSHFNTAKVKSMYTMFAYCVNLKVLDVSQWNTSNVTDMQWMFYECGALTELDVSGFDTANVEFMNYMFYHCKGLKELDVSKWNTAKVLNMESMFDGCVSLTKLDVSKWNVANVTDMISTFYQCGVLTALDVSQWNTANVTDMFGLFYECSGLTVLDVSQWNVANVTDMCYMFFNCSRLKALDMSQWNTANVTEMAGMFELCNGLKTLNVSQWNTANVTNMSAMFHYCPSLTELDVSGFDTFNVVNMAWMFEGCSNLKTIYASDKFRTDFALSSNSMFSGCESLVGGNETKYSEEYVDKTYARMDMASAPGYFTAKSAAPAAYAITNAVLDKAAGKLSVTFTHPGAATLTVAYFDANGKFLSASMQNVSINAGTVEFPLPSGATTAHAISMNNAFRPLCALEVALT